ncbi:hypothetical protein BJY04DRAFT_219655 [Aspergillus karnatakaensis]|uniref:uncharacterized protein n=1 Tax=Aspergillus karnatakaensis TaxID=1810916 RepID=UPI003CCD8624
MSLNPIDNCTATPLLIVMHQDVPELLDLLHTHSIQSVNAQLRNHRTLLSFAAEMGKVRLVDYLLARKDVDPDSKDVLGATPLWRARWCRRQPDESAVLQRLVEVSGHAITADILAAGVKNTYDGKAVPIAITEHFLKAAIENESWRKDLLGLLSERQPFLLTQSLFKHAAAHGDAELVDLWLFGGDCSIQIDRDTLNVAAGNSKHGFHIICYLLQKASYDITLYTLQLAPFDRGVDPGYSVRKLPRALLSKLDVSPRSAPAIVDFVLSHLGRGRSILYLLVEAAVASKFGKAVLEYLFKIPDLNIHISPFDLIRAVGCCDKDTLPVLLDYYKPTPGDFNGLIYAARRNSNVEEIMDLLHTRRKAIKANWTKAQARQERQQDRVLISTLFVDLYED